MTSLKKKTLLYRVVEPPVPFLTGSIDISPDTDKYVLDYKVTTGKEMAIADMQYTKSNSFYRNYAGGWNYKIGAAISGSIWCLGMYKDQITPVGSTVSIRIGSKYGNGSGNTVYANIGANYYANTIAKRCLWHYGLGFLQVYLTSGNWEDGTQCYDVSSSAVTQWSGLIGKSMQIGSISGSGHPADTIAFYGLRVYDQKNGNLVADYEAGTKGGVPVIHNKITGKYIYNTGG